MNKQSQNSEKVLFWVIIISFLIWLVLPRSGSAQQPSLLFPPDPFPFNEVVKCDTYQDTVYGIVLYTDWKLSSNPEWKHAKAVFHGNSCTIGFTKVEYFVYSIEYVITAQNDIGTLAIQEPVLDWFEVEIENIAIWIQRPGE
jgi:hypothetical protein